MLGSTQWRFRTPLHELVLKLDPLAPRPSSADLELSRALLFELLVLAEHGQPEVTSILCQLEEALVGGGRLDVPVAEAPLEPHALSERLAAQLGMATLRGALAIQRLQTRSEGPIDFLPDLDFEDAAAAAAAEPDLTFIAVKLVDQDGDPIAGENVRIQLPDGTIKQGRTDENGEFLVDELRKGGQAKISLPDVMQPGAAEPVTLDEFVEIELLDEDGNPVPGVPYWLKDAEGTMHQGVLDEHGTAYISPIPKGECTVNFYGPPAASEEIAPTAEPSEEEPPEVEPSEEEPPEAEPSEEEPPEVEPPEVEPPEVPTPEGDAIDPSDALIPSPVPAVAPNEARRVRMLGMLFDADKTFLLPQALPGIKAMVEMHQQHPSGKLLAVGHAAGDEVLAGGSLALARAKALSAYLTHDVDVWHKEFAPQKPARSRWGTREVQLMLSMVPEGAPLYQGYPSGVTDAKTKTAVKEFQKSKGLVVDGKVGPKTLKALIDAYMALEGTTLEKGTRVVVCGCDGHVEDDPSKDGGEVDDRRVELFLFDLEIAPAPSAPVLPAGNAEFTAWRSALVESTDFENHGIHAQILDAKNKPVPQAAVTLTGPISANSTTDDHGFVSFFNLVPGEYELSAKREGFQGTQKLRYPTGKTVAGISAATHGGSH